MQSSIKELRTAKGITQEQFASIVGVTQGTISQWETGRTFPNSKKLPIVAKTLEISIDDLIGLVEKAG